MSQLVASSVRRLVLGVLTAGLCAACGDPGPPGVAAAGPLACPPGAQMKESEIPLARGGGRQERCVNSAGQRHGPSRGYFPDGQIRYYTEWWEGKKHGRFAHWWPNGQQKAEGAHREWEPDGVWTNWDESGDLTSEYDYSKGGFPTPASAEGDEPAP